jgi:hypothetical protein
LSGPNNRIVQDEFKAPQSFYLATKNIHEWDLDDVLFKLKACLFFNAYFD